MGDAFASVGAIVDDDAEAFFKASGFSLFAGGEEEVSEEFGVVFIRFSNTNDRFLRDDEQVSRGLGADIVKDDAAVIFENDLGWDLSGDDFFKESRRSTHRILDTPLSVNDGEIGELGCPFRREGVDIDHGFGVGFFALRGEALACSLDGNFQSGHEDEAVLIAGNRFEAFQ